MENLSLNVLTSSMPGRLMKGINHSVVLCAELPRLAQNSLFLFFYF